ncbi:cation efflux protein, CzcI family [Rubrivivax sp. A210]|uniref:cation efflux protein, CzcI family n=1 Tax=Rubrivivax sp. A210 TaxID=2772301 RepID=UPI0039869E02
MRRWLAMLLLALLPLQFSWAAAAVYCGHESGEPARHLGHHEHQHEGQAGLDKDGAPVDQGAPAGFDLDCGHCHVSFASLPAPAASLSSALRAPHPVVQAEVAVRTLPQSPPERPQWSPLA